MSEKWERGKKIFLSRWLLHIERQESEHSYTKEPYSHTKETYSLFLEWYSLFWEFLKDKNPNIHTQKRPIHTQKRPIRSFWSKFTLFGVFERQESVSLIALVWERQEWWTREREKSHIYTKETYSHTKETYSYIHLFHFSRVREARVMD